MLCRAMGLMLAPRSGTVGPVNGAKPSSGLPGRIKVGDKVLPDPVNYGEISVSRVIEKSSQVGVTKIAQALGHEPILDVFARSGLGGVGGGWAGKGPAGVGRSAGRQRERGWEVDSRGGSEEKRGRDRKSTRLNSSHKA